MIDIDDKYCIGSGVSCFTAYVKTKRISKKTGKPDYDIIGYYADLKRALKGIVRDATLNMIQSEDMTLNEAINRIDAIYEKYERILNENIKEG